MVVTRELELLLLILLFPGLTGQEAFEVVNHLPSSQPPIAFPIGEVDLPLISSSTAEAERWVRTHVLPSLPTVNVTTLLVGRGVLCSDAQWGLVQPCALNLHYSLLKLGLLSRTRVAVSFSSDCLAHLHNSTLLRPLLVFLRDSHSAYTIHPSSLAAAAHMFAPEKLGGVERIRVVGLKKAEERIVPRLSSVASSSPEPMAVSPARRPLPPVFKFSPAPDASFSFVPAGSPPEVPGGFPSPPPCLVAAPAPAPAAEKLDLWCVAKPAVPLETLQEAMDFACGEGGANCEEIRPSGDCYYPDNIVAHASFAFNSYWQNTKRRGGTCGFGGTAMLVTSDPSYQHCRFELS